MIETLDRAIDEVADVDVDGLSDSELHHLAVGLLEAESRFAAARARVLAAWDARRIWANDGSKAAAARLARDIDGSAVTTRGELKRSRKLRSMPATRTALAEGKLSVDKADLLAAANQPGLAGLFARDEQLLINEIVGLRYPDAHRVVRYWISQAHDEVGTPPSVCRRDGRYFNAVRTFGSTVDLQGCLDPIAGTEFLTELQRREQELFESDWSEARDQYGEDARPEQLARTAPQRRADALVEMARRSAAASAGAQRPRPLITVIVGWDAFARTCELAEGTVIAPNLVVPLLGDADIERIVFDGPSRVIDVGHRRLFTGALRRAIEVRDRRCQHPCGCDVPYERCQIDHIIPSSAGGPTTQENGRCYCPVHNRARHKRRERPPPDDE